MKASPRIVLPLVGAFVLTGAVLGTVLWPKPSTSPLVEDPSTSAPAVPGASAPRVPRSLPPRPMYSTAPASAERRVAGKASPNSLPQVNQQGSSEEPQTAQWKLGMAQRNNSQLMRDVARLEQDRNAAATRGDEAARLRLETVLQDHRERLQEMREEIQALSAQAESDLPAQ